VKIQEMKKMDRKRFSNVAEFVGVAALVLSLIFVEDYNAHGGIDNE